MKSVGTLGIGLALALSTLAVGAADMQAYLQETQKMVRAGEYEEALKRHVWFHENALDHNPGMTGVRLSFALSDWARLGEKYPPALEELKALRAAKEEKIRDGEGSFELFHDVTAINRTLSQPEKTLELFKSIEEESPELSARYWIVVKDVAFQFKDYELINRNLSDVEGEYRKIYANYLRTIGPMRNTPAGDWMEKKFKADTDQLAALATHNGDAKAAQKIKERARKVLASKDGIVE